MNSQQNGLRTTIAGFCTLVMVMGIGRFVYTALIPDMMHTHGFDEGTAGVMAAWNYAGYLAGVLVMRNEKPGLRRYLLFAVFLVLSLLSTAGMAWVSSVPLWHAMRFLSGFASGVCFVLCSAIVLDALAVFNRPVLAGFVYSGPGAGIALGGFLAPLFSLRYGVDGAWLGMAFICVPLMLVSLIFLRPSVTPAPPEYTPAASLSKAKSFSFPPGYLALLSAYFLEGFGYIIGTTFLVALVKASTDSATLANASWVITGCAAALTAPLWRLAARKGYLPMLILAFTLQGIGVFLPAVSSAPVVILCSGLLLGGTFMGISVLSLQYGVSISGKSSAHTIAIMTAVYGIGQIIGPLVAGISARSGGGFGPSFALSSASLFVGALILAASLLGKKKSP